MENGKMPDPNMVHPISGYEKEIYVKPTVTNPNILVGDFTYIADSDFESHVTHHYEFNGKEAYAICLKEDGKAIGAIELKLNGHTDMTDRDDECEMGYWLGKPFWGQGIMPEAVKEMLRHAFEDCGMQKVWIGYYEGNQKSKRVQEKCGFKYQWRSEDVDVPLMHEKRTGHVSLMTKEDWMAER